MKKYTKLMNLTLFITLVFTSFFFWKAHAASPNPKVKIVTVEGNVEYLNPVQLHAYISNDQAYGFFPVLQLRDNKVKYNDDLPFIAQVDSYSDPLIDELIKDYRSFMRGKNRRADQYLVTEDLLVYTAMSTDVYWWDSAENQLIISILNKQTKKEEDFLIDLDDDMNHYNLETAQLSYPELSIVLTKYDADGNSQNIISTFDFENPEAGLIERVNFTDQIEQEDYFYMANSFNKTDRFIPFQSVQITQTEEENYEDEFYTDSYETTGYFVYDITERKFIDIPLFEENDTLLFIDQNRIYVAEDLGETLDFYEMNPDTEELEAIGNIQMASASIGRNQLHQYNELFNQNITILDGKLYAFEQQEINGSYLPVFQVIDLEKNETLFLGRLDAADGSKRDAPNIEVSEYRLNPLTN